MVLALPFPNGVDELFASEIVSRLLLLAPKHVLDDALGRNTGVITSRHPQGCLAVHTVPPNHHVLKGVSKSVAHVESTSDVRRRVNDDERSGILDLAILLELGLEEALLLPPAIPGRLDGDRVVRLEVGVFERSDALLLTLGGILDVFGNGCLFGLLRFLLFRDLGAAAWAVLSFFASTWAAFSAFLRSVT